MAGQDLRPEPLSTQPEPQISVQVDDRFAAEVDAADLQRTIATVLETEGEPDAEVTLVVTDDEVIHALNLEFLGEDHPTDVLSFPAREEVGDSAAAAQGATFVTSPEADAYLGDIVIAFPYARRQAEGLGRRVADELRLLAVHGALHLLGYDHAEPAEEAEMWARQDAILARL